MTIAFGFPITSTSNVLRISGLSMSSDRFTCPYTTTLSGIFLRVTTSNYEMSGLVGIQSDNAGLPDGNYLCSGIFNFGSSTSTGSNKYLWDTALTTATLNSGTIYHFVLQPLTFLPNGSTFQLMVLGGSGTNLYHYVSSTSFTKNYRPVQDQDRIRVLSYDSGDTWTATSTTRYHCACIAPIFSGLMVNTFLCPYNSSSTPKIGGYSGAGILFKCAETMTTSGVWFQFTQAAANAGSLYLYIDYSGINGDRTAFHVGSWNMEQTVVSWNYRNMYNDWTNGSIYYIYFIAPYGQPSGTGSSYSFQGQTAINAPRAFGGGSIYSISLGSIGSNIAVSTINSSPIYFVLSGTGEQPTPPSAYIYQYNSGFESYS
jgi:hypothetical protein